MSQSVAKVSDMSVEELLGFFKAFCPEIKVFDADLRNPQAEKTQEIYRWFVKRLTGCKDVDLSQVNYRVSEAGYFEYPDLHQNSYSLVTLVLAVNYIFTELDVISFKISDLINPKSKRTIKFFGQLARFAQFTRTRSPFVEGILQKVQFVKDERVALRSENEDLKEKISKIKAAEAEKEHLCKKLALETERLRASLQREKESRAILDANSAVLTEKLKSFQSSLAKVQTEAEKLRAEAKKLGSMIVSSPKKYSQEVENLKKRKSQLEKEVESVQAELVKFNSKQQKNKEVETMVNSLMDLIAEVNEEMNSQKSLQMSIKPMEDSIIRLQHKISDMELTLNERRQLLENTEGITARQRQSHLSQMNGIKAEITTWRNKVATLKAAGQQKEIAAKEIEVECRRIEEEIETRKKLHEINIKLLKEKYAETVATADMRAKDFQLRCTSESESITRAQQTIKTGRPMQIPVAKASRIKPNDLQAK